MIRGVDRSRSLRAKRLFDLAVGSILLVVALPIMGGVAVAIVLDSPGPIFFRQEREGLHGRRFKIYKFRTMTSGAHRSGPVLSMRDPRVTKVGRFLRRSSLDELPQLVNVLIGDMSLVGPRPLLPGTTRAGEELRLAMLPGMTGLVEVRDAHALDWDQRMEVDLEYVRNWSFTLDMMILVRTVGILLSRKDVLDHPRPSGRVSDGAEADPDPEPER